MSLNVSWFQNCNLELSVRLQPRNQLTFSDIEFSCREGSNAALAHLYCTSAAPRAERAQHGELQEHGVNI